METFFDHYLGKYGGKLLFRNNLKQQDCTLLNLKVPFLKEIIQYWTKFNYKDDNLDCASTCIWYNSHIRIENRPFFYRSWLLEELGWDRIFIRKIKLLAIEMFKVHNNMAPEYLCQKVLKMRSTCDIKGSSSLLIASSQNQ